MQRSLNWIAATALALSLLAGCGGGGGGTPPNITAAAGGTVTSEDGRVTLVVPPGAAPRDMTVRIVAANPTVPSDIGVLAGYSYAIEGDGGDLSADAELSFTLAASSAPTPASAADRRHALGGSVVGPPPPGNACPEGTVRVIGPGGFEICEAWPPEPAVLSTSGLAKLDRCRFLPANLRLVCSMREVLPKTVVLLHDREPPSVSVVATTVPVTTAGSVNFVATVTDNRGVYGVQFLLGRFTGNGWIDDTPTVVLSPPFGLLRSFGPGDSGAWHLRVVARDNNGNLAHVDLPFVVNIPAGPVPDTTAPAVTLGASSTAVTVGDTVALTATASDNVGVTRVEFFKGATLLGERTSAPYELTTPAFVAGDVGTPQVFTARAFDAAGNNASSAPVTVAVSAMSTGDVYVNAASGLDTNAGTAAAPFRTLAQAFTAVGSGGTVWLQNGSYTLATEGTDLVTGRTVPTGIAVRAVNPLGATVGFPIRFAGSGALSGVQMDASSNASVVATTGGGTVTLSRLQWMRLGAGGVAAAITVNGNVNMTLDTGGNPAHEYVAATGVASLAQVDGNAQLSINGGHIDRLSGGGVGGMVRIGGNAAFTLSGVTWTNASGAVVSPNAIRIDGTAPTVTLNNTTIDLTGAVDVVNGGSACILGVPSVVPSGGAPTITLNASVLSRCPGDGIQIRAGTPTIVLQNGSQIANAGFHGLRTGVFAPSNAAAPTISISNSQVVNSGRSGVELLAGGSLAMTGATVSNNGLLLSDGGVRLLGAFTYSLSMRGSTVSDNFGNAGSGGVVMHGSAGSIYDLGSNASAGGNTIRNNGLASTGLRTAVAAGVTVLAVGNAFNINVQGSNASGAYTSASSVCGGANPCNVTTGSGVNFAVSSGTLRLVHD